jgi:hypothetical protein
MISLYEFRTVLGFYPKVSLRWTAKAFNPDQPRDDHGRWEDTGGKEKQFTHGKTTIGYSVSGKTATIEEVSTWPVQERGKGEGRAAMGAFLAHADAAGMTVELTAAPLGHREGQSSAAAAEHLQAWYRSLGFVHTDSGDRSQMSRKPRT